ncbi:alpha/beta hydrolase [Chloroflexota bacterium]
MNKRTVVLEVDGLKITGQLYLPNGGNQTPYPTVCVCHGIPSGNPPDPGDRGYPLLAEKICQEGFVVFIFNFRGTGTSSGNLDMLGWSRDLKAAIDYLCTLPDVDMSGLSLLGFSGGAAVSVYVAAHDARISAVVACACPAEFNILNRLGNPSSRIDRFRSIGTIRDKDFPQSVEEWIDGFREVSPINHVAEIAPRYLLLVHGNRDEIVDVSHACELYAKAGEPKQLIVVEGAGHGLRKDGRAMTIVTDWLKS